MGLIVKQQTPIEEKVEKAVRQKQLTDKDIFPIIGKELNKVWWKTIRDTLETFFNRVYLKLTGGTMTGELIAPTAKFGSSSNYSEFESDGTLHFEGDATTWDDMRVVPGSFDRPGTSDPTITSVQPGGSGTATFLYRFEKNNIASFTIQLPHSYKLGSDLRAHIHWTPGARGVAENGATVGWKIDYTWASINSNFGVMATIDLSDACDGVDWKHQMTPQVTITGADKGISSMLICNVKRTDTGTDDTWAGTGVNSPFLLEIDFHYEIDTIGSRETASK